MGNKRSQDRELNRENMKSLVRVARNRWRANKGKY